jgi:hypothetical protein
MSFDNTERRLEYVRHGAGWSKIQHNLKLIKDLMKNQGHWGGIHAVYNIYNATRICELREFAEQTGTTVVWQNLFQPEYLDPFLHGPGVAQLAIDEIEQFYAMGIATPAEKIFFDNSLNMYRDIKQAHAGVEEKFKQHILDIETVFHPDQLGQFEQLWPELAHLCR